MIVTGPGTGGAVAQSKNIRVARGLQLWRDHKLVQLVRFQSEVFEEIRRLDTGRPHRQLGGNPAPVGDQHVGGFDRGDTCIDQHLYAQFFQQFQRGFGQAFRQRRQYPWPGFDQRDADVALGVDALQAERHQFARRVVQFGGEFDAGGAGADDCHMQLLGTQRFMLRVGADAGIDQPVVEAFGLRRRVEADRVFLRARRAEIIGAAADGDHQRVVTDLAFADQQPAFLVMGGRNLHHAALAIQPGHAAEAKTEMVPARLCQIIQRVLIDVHAASRDFVQQRFPQMGA